MSKIYEITYEGKTYQGRENYWFETTDLRLVNNTKLIDTLKSLIVLSEIKGLKKDELDNG